MRWRLIRWGVAAFLVLLVAGAVIGILTFDPESQKTRIIEAVKRATGRDMQLKGPIKLALSLRPSIEVRDIVLSNPPGFSRPDMAVVEKVDLQLALLPLISQRIEVDKLIVTNPDIRLETDAKGQPNWVFTPAQTLPPTAAGGGSGGGGKSAPMAIDLQNLRLDNGAFSFHDGKSGKLSTLTVKQIATKAVSLDAPLHLIATFVVEGGEVALTIDTGPLGRLSDAAATGPWPVKLAVAGPGGKIGIEGTVANPATGQGIDLGLTADISDLSVLAQSARQTMPAMRSLTFSAKVKDDPKGPAHGLLLHDVKLTSPEGSVTGELAVAFGPPMNLTGSLKSDRIDADVWLTSAPAASSTPAPASPPGVLPGPAEAKTRWLIPDRPLPFASLQSTGADLKVAIGALRFGGADYKSITAHAVIHDGVLTVDPASADLPQGHVGMTLTADTRKAPPPVHVTLRAPGIALGPLLAALGKPAYATGNLEVLADLHGIGASAHAIAASVDGHIGLALAGGTVDIKGIGGAAARIKEAVHPGAPAGYTELRCMALRLDFSGGVGTVKALAFGSAQVNMEGSGSVNLADETLAVSLRSHAVVSGARVIVPVRVSGSIAAPQTRVDEIGIAQSNAAAIGALLSGGKLPGGGGDVCPGALASARGQAAPAVEPVSPSEAPAQPPQPKLPNAGQLLKQLFH